MADLDELALGLPQATKEVSEDGRPSYLVHGKRSPRPHPRPGEARPRGAVRPRRRGLAHACAEARREGLVGGAAVRGL